MTVFAKGDQANSTMAETAEITILPTPPPEVRRFAATQPRYWEALAPSLRPSEADSDTASDTASENIVALNWQITGIDQLSHLLLANRLASNGSLLNSPQRYNLSEGLPEALEEFCTLTETDLTCRAFPTAARTVGTYIFELSLFAPDSDEPITTAETEPIPIVPLPVRIETFTVNGDPAPTKYQVQPPSADETAEDTVQLAWRIIGGPYTQVELLPAPGSVSLVGDLSYPLTANTQEVVTLVVTSVSGETITRSVTLETLQPAASDLDSLPTPEQAETMLTVPPPPETVSSPESAPTSTEVPPQPPAAETSPALPETPRSPTIPPAKPESQPTKPE
ncbi:MAG: hypothetical protein F6K42_31740 [Leptolyngbya sp. SIO1D8]|nr:hypothetical protein [Leptolyngbya sp. SIO1D8]